MPMKRMTRMVVLVLAGCGLAAQARAGVFIKPIQPPPAPCTKCVTPGTAVPSPYQQTAAPPLAPGQAPGYITPVGTAPAGQPARLLSPPADGEVITEGSPLAPEAAVTRVKSKHLVFTYDYRDVGPSGVSGVEVWYTHDGGATWQKFPGLFRENPCAVDVEDEGLYGITIIAKTGFGGGKDGPQPGDQPQMWVDVDTTKPSLMLTEVTPGAGTHTLTVQWSARDKNFGRKPITLYYAEQTAGPWVPVTTSTENTGNFVWQIPPTTPNSFFLRVEAIDLAGNVATADTASPILIDLSQPAVTNIRLTSGK
jgi:hypothetical protein